MINAQITTIPIMATIKIPIGDFLKTMHSTQASQAKRPVGKQAGDQQQPCVSGQTVIRQSVCTSECNHHANQSDGSQTNAHHGRLDSEDVDGDILL